MTIDSTDTALRVAIVRRALTVRRRGYDTAEVDELLDTVSKLADALLAEADGTARHLAEAEAELVGIRAEVRELHEVKAATEQLLANTRAELHTLRHATQRDEDAEEKLVVADAELRIVRASAEHTEVQLQEARELLTLEQAARGTVEAQLAGMAKHLSATDAQLGTVTAQVAEAIGGQARDPFAEVGDEVAALLRAAVASGDEIRRRASEDADVLIAEAADVRREARRQVGELMAEAEELAASLLDDAESRAMEAEARVISIEMLEQVSQSTGGNTP